MNDTFAALTGVARHALGQDAPLQIPDPDELYRLAESHRMLPQLEHCLRQVDVPVAMRTRLADFARLNSENNLRLVFVSVAVAGALTEAGIPCIILKGPLLAAELFGDVSLRTCRDVDVLIERAQAARACEILSAAGWQPEEDLVVRGVGALLASRHDIAFVRTDGTILELHCDAAQPHYSFAVSIPAWFERAQTLDMAGQSIKVLSHEDALLFALIHGTKHLWSRLDLLLDVAALQRRMGDPVVLREQVAQAGLLRAAAVAVQLTDTLLGVRTCDFRLDATGQWLANRFAVRMARANDTPFWEARALDILLRERVLDRSRYVIRMARRLLASRHRFRPAANALQEVP